jgi:hypothetical protein
MFTRRGLMFKNWAIKGLAGCIIVGSGSFIFKGCQLSWENAQIETAVVEEEEDELFFEEEVIVDAVEKRETGTTAVAWVPLMAR